MKRLLSTKFCTTSSLTCTYSVNFPEKSDKKHLIHQRKKLETLKVAAKWRAVATSEIVVGGGENNGFKQVNRFGLQFLRPSGGVVSLQQLVPLRLIESLLLLSLRRKSRLFVLLFEFRTKLFVHLSKVQLKKLIMNFEFGNKID
uniref:Uncharacterized protein n=1 Tax=Romanomermis culicivorax TaxID=13658 RepID=A0A915IUU0_ROMCU